MNQIIQTKLSVEEVIRKISFLVSPNSKTFHWFTDHNRTSSHPFDGRYKNKKFNLRYRSLHMGIPYYSIKYDPVVKIKLSQRTHTTLLNVYLGYSFGFIYKCIIRLAIYSFGTYFYYKYLTENPSLLLSKLPSIIILGSFIYQFIDTLRNIKSTDKLALAAIQNALVETKGNSDFKI